MKKTILLLAAGALAIGSNAQMKTGAMLPGSHQDKGAIKEQVNKSADFGSRFRADNAKKKTTAALSRWYIPFNMYIDVSLAPGIENNLSVTPLFFDSTVQQRFIDGLHPINYISVAQVVDPASGGQMLLFNDPNYNAGTELALKSGDTYSIDSVVISGTYQRIAGKENIVDTMIISLGLNTIQYYWLKSNTAWAAQYIPNQDTLWGIAPTSADSVNRAIYSDVATTPRKMWKVPLTDAMRTDNLDLQDFVFEVPGGFTVPNAANRVAMSFTFKSGDTWTQNVDTFNSMNNFRALFGEADDSQPMPYFYYTDRDRNGSSLMFSSDTAFYAPAVAIEGWNDATFRSEFLFAGFFANCANCKSIDELVGVHDVTGLIKQVNAYPNPASTEVSIPFSLNEMATVNVSIVNTVGQTLKSQNMGKVSSGKATFATADLANGVYFYTVEANGQRMTNRFVVAR